MKKISIFWEKHFLKTFKYLLERTIFVFVFFSVMFELNQIILYYLIEKNIIF